MPRFHVRRNYKFARCMHERPDLKRKRTTTLIADNISLMLEDQPASIEHRIIDSYHNPLKKNFFARRSRLFYLSVVWWTEQNYLFKSICRPIEILFIVCDCNSIFEIRKKNFTFSVILKWYIFINHAEWFLSNIQF